MKVSRVASPAWVSLIPYVSAHACSKTVDVDVAIIGGGSGGIHAAIQLKDAGAKVMVIEKKHQIGGHAETYINPKTGRPANIGVVLFESRDVVSNYFGRLNVSAISFNPLEPTPGAPATKMYDFSLGVEIPDSAAAAQQQAIVDAIPVYAQNVLTKYPTLDEGFILDDPVPEELAMPFGQFAQKYNFTALMPLIWQFNWHEGEIADIPALYGIKSFGPGLLGSVAGDFIMAASGNTRSLYDAALAELGSDVLLNATVAHVDRNTTESGGVTVVVQQPGHGATRVRAKKLIFAVPPTLENIGGYDLTAEEHDLLARFSAVGYWTGLAEVPGLTANLQNVGISRPFYQPTIPGVNGFQLAGSGDADVLFGVGFDTANYTDEDGAAVVRASLAKLAAVGAVPADAAETVTFPYTSNHAPFNVRVSGDDIKDGFYAKLMALEGKRNTYWTGAAFGSHNSALIWEFNMGSVLPSLKKDLGLA